MVFRLGQTPFHSGKNHRVTAYNNDGVVAVTLGHGVSRCLGVGPGSRLSIAYSSRPGELYVTRARGRNAVDLYQNGPQVAFNINNKFLPSVAASGPVPVRSYWRDTETMVLDFTPTHQEQAHDRSHHGSAPAAV